MSVRFLIPVITLLVVTTPSVFAATADNVVCSKCVGQKDIAFQAVGTGRLKDAAVTEAKLADGSVTPEKLSFPALTGGVKNTGTQSIFIDDNPGSTVASIFLTAPVEGLVILFASGYADFNNIDSYCSCTLTTGAAVEALNEMFFEGGSGADRRTSWSTHRAFTVPAGDWNYNLICYEGAGGNVELNDVKMSAIFVEASVANIFPTNMNQNVVPDAAGSDFFREQP